MLSTIQKNLSKMAKATSFPLLQQLKPGKISIFRLDFNIEEKTRKRLSAFIAGTMLFSYLSIAPVEVLASGYDPYSFSSEDTSDRGITSEPNSLKEKRLNEESLQRAKALADQEAKRKAQEQAQSKAGNNNSQSDMEQKRQEAKLRASGAYSTLPNQQQNNTSTDPNAKVQDLDDYKNEELESPPSKQQAADEERTKATMILKDGEKAVKIEAKSLLPSDLKLFDYINEEDLPDAFAQCRNHVKEKGYSEEEAGTICSNKANIVRFTACLKSHTNTDARNSGCYDVIDVTVKDEQKEVEKEESLCDKVKFHPSESADPNDWWGYGLATGVDFFFGFDDCVDAVITLATTVLAFTGVGVLAGAGKLIAGTGKISQMLTKLGIKAFPKVDVLAIEGAETEEKLGRAKAVLERAKKAGDKNADELLEQTKKMEKSIDKAEQKVEKLEDKVLNAKNKEMEEKALDKLTDAEVNLFEKGEKAETFLETNRETLSKMATNQEIRESISDSIAGKVLSNRYGRGAVFITGLTAKEMHDNNNVMNQFNGDKKTSSYYSSQKENVRIAQTSDTQKKINQLNEDLKFYNQKAYESQGMENIKKRQGYIEKAQETTKQITQLSNSNDVERQQYLEQVATQNKENAQKGFMTTNKNQNNQ